MKLFHFHAAQLFACISLAIVITCLWAAFFNFLTHLLFVNDSRRFNKVYFIHTMNNQSLETNLEILLEETTNLLDNKMEGKLGNK